MVPISKKLGFGSVLGYLAAGIVIGPFGLGFIRDGEHILHFAELGVVFLLFVIGLELQPSRLWVLRRMVFGLGSAQVMISAGAIASVVDNAVGDLSASANLIEIAIDNAQLKASVFATFVPKGASSPAWIRFSVGAKTKAGANNETLTIVVSKSFTAIGAAQYGPALRVTNFASRNREIPLPDVNTTTGRRSAKRTTDGKGQEKTSREHDRRHDRGSDGVVRQ